LESYTEYDPAWATNYSAFNDSWATTWNSTYDAYIVADSAGLWDALDTPADINAADITDDDTYALVAGETFTGDLNTSAFNYTGCADDYILKVSGINWGCEVDDTGTDTTCDTGDQTCTFDDDTIDLFGVTFTNTLHGGNITADSLSGTQIAELADADISNTLTCSILTDDNTYVTVAGDTMGGDITMGANDILGATWVNSTNMNVSTEIYATVICGNAACTDNITYNGSSWIIYS